MVKLKSEAGQLRCFVKLMEPRKREGLLVVKVANVKPLLDAFVVCTTFERYACVAAFSVFTSRIFLSSKTAFACSS